MNSSAKVLKLFILSHTKNLEDITNFGEDNHKPPLPDKATQQAPTSQAAGAYNIETSKEYSNHASLPHDRKV